ncbi:hypothetical protein AC1031_007966 [Aphanomyces cochlioides]|nr:hypothetical protein AC1031_007966 [Aphanomyces cochlioides]
MTEQEWTEYFQYALKYHCPDYGDLEAKIRTSVIMDDKELDPNNCYDKWAYAYWALLDKNNMRSFNTKYPKNAVKALMDGSTPGGAAGSSEKSFGTRSEAPPQFSGTAAKASVLVKVPDDINPKAKAMSRQNSGGASKSAGASQQPKIMKCWSCGGPHDISKCESTSDADKIAIRAKRAEAKPKGSVPKDGSDGKAAATAEAKSEAKKALVTFKTKALKWLDGPPKDGSCWSVVVHGGLDDSVLALLDSGCDSGLIVSHGLVDKLSSTSALDLQLAVLDSPQVMKGFGGVPLTLSRHVVVPELALLVGDTPVLLTSVSAWVDDTDPTLAITVG